MNKYKYASLGWESYPLVIDPDRHKYGHLVVDNGQSIVSQLSLVFWNIDQSRIWWLSSCQSIWNSDLIEICQVA